MLINSISGLCERRLILNWRVDPDIVAKLLPRPFRPRLVNGHAIVGMDVLKLAEMRPTGLPAFTGFSTENAIDRIAVEWDEGGTIVQGLYVPHRYSPSTVNALVSSARLFPTIFTHALFDFNERAGRYQVSVFAGANRFELDANESKTFAEKSILGSPNAASDFHRDAKISYSPSPDKDKFDAIYLKTLDWKATPLSIKSVSYSYIDRLYPGAVFDSALVMHSTKHEWHGLGSISASGSWITEEQKPAAKTATKKPVPKAASAKNSSSAKKTPTKKPSSKAPVAQSKRGKK